MNVNFFYFDSRVVASSSQPFSIEVRAGISLRNKIADKTSSHDRRHPSITRHIDIDNKRYPRAAGARRW
ncbi:hypothetical protein EVAR_42597_1 [Eumeta japonica]|uniref:Uncharacterized protein n=1 Tax=Eumeta variegata TaxID=151549 RepID=A0A4C1XQX8_EUMVA|nr:hypothetical protein EVAR_42597_1 [Eumeta japonica]